MTLRFGAKCGVKMNLRWQHHYFIIDYIFTRAVQKLIAINRIKNKSLCLHNIFVCAVYNYFV